MKVYIYVSAAHFNDECTDIMDVQVFTNAHEAIGHLNRTIEDLTSEEGGWKVFSSSSRHYQLTDGDEEYVAYVTEREI